MAKAEASVAALSSSSDDWSIVAKSGNKPGYLDGCILVDVFSQNDPFHEDR